MNLKSTTMPICLVLLFFGNLCRAQGGAHGHAHGDERSIAFTVWTDTFEIFAEHPFVVAGTPAPFVTHVTELKTSSPRTQGAVTFVMTLGSQRMEYRDPAPQRNGIYIPELVFPRSGTWAVALQVPMDGATYDIRFPPVQVYETQAEADQAPDPVEPEGFSFLKEQQWIIPFQVEQVTSRTRNGVTYRAVPESALAYSGDRAYVYVQLGGETFERRRVQVDAREQGEALVSLGLNEQEHVVTLGVGSVALAQGEPAGQGTGGAVHVTDEQVQRFQIVCREAVTGGVDAWVQAPGQIRINRERMAHVVPRVKGVVSEVRADIGRHVRSGQVLAVIESRDLADAKAEFLSALERQELDRSQFEREERLFQQKVTSEQDYLSSRQAFAKARIERRAARQKLLALGLTKQEVDDLPAQPEEAFTTYAMTAPFDGTIIRKHIVLGEVVDDTSETFVIADLSTVWVDLKVNQKDIESIKIGQPAEVFRDHSFSGIRSRVSYVDQVLDPATRTAVARMVLDNAQGRYRPGTFVTGRIGVQSRDREIIVPADAVQIVNDKPCVFVKTDEGFALRYVVLGQKEADRVEILSGVENGEQLVVRNAFHLKAELTKQAVSGHGHVH